MTIRSEDLNKLYSNYTKASKLAGCYVDVSDITSGEVGFSIICCQKKSSFIRLEGIPHGAEGRGFHVCLQTSLWIFYTL